jgi:hypothetical protein
VLIITQLKSELDSEGAAPLRPKFAIGQRPQTVPSKSHLIKGLTPIDHSSINFQREFKLLEGLEIKSLRE